MDLGNVLNFQELVEEYEKLIKEITEEFDTLKVEHQENKLITIKLVNENKELSSKITELLNEKLNRSTVEYLPYYHKETDLNENLHKQLILLISEKEDVTQLWQNAIQTVDLLEEELRFYQSNEFGVVPKSKLTKLKSEYECKIENLEKVLKQTQIKLERSVQANSKQLELKNSEIRETRSNHKNSFEIIKNLEEEIIKLQDRLKNCHEIKTELEKTNRNKTEDLEKLKQQNYECKRKVEEAVQIVEAALNEKDAALLRENHAQEEVEKLSTTLSEIIDETNEKIKKEINIIKNDYNIKLVKAQSDLESAKNEIKIHSIEIEKYKKECTLLNGEIDKLRTGHLYYDDSNTSKLLVLEKNLENTFQKLLISEKQNIQVASEKESIKNDLDQMANFYERDIKARDTETILLKNKIKTMEIEIKENYSKLMQSTETINNLNNKIESMETDYTNQIENNKTYFEEQHKKTLEAITTENSNKLKQLSEQLALQREINQKWRTETKIITEKLTNRIKELKLQIGRINSENKLLIARLRECDGNVEGYKKMLRTISENVNKITSASLPELHQCTK